MSNMKTRNFRSYFELSKLKTFEERFEYLRLNGRVAEETFASHRWINQALYRSAEWKHVRNKVILRDSSCDLGVEDYPLYSHIIIHHINPLTLADIENGSSLLFDMDNLICVSEETHNAIHYGSSDTLIYKKVPVERFPNDMSPWRIK